MIIYFVVPLHKISCTSAIEVDFIAPGLHYFVSKNKTAVWPQ